MRPRGRDRLFITRVCVPRDAGSRIVRKYALETNTHLRRSVSHNYLPGVERIADSDTPAVVKRNPGRAACDVQHRIQDWPVGDCISPVAHAFRLTEWGSDAASVEVIPTDGYRR
jgi:hypothetical protein